MPAPRRGLAALGRRVSGQVQQHQRAGLGGGRFQHGAGPAHHELAAAGAEPAVDVDTEEDAGDADVLRGFLVSRSKQKHFEIILLTVHQRDNCQRDSPALDDPVRQHREPDL